MILKQYIHDLKPEKLHYGVKVVLKMISVQGKNAKEMSKPSRYSEREDDVDQIFKELKEKYQNTFDVPKLRLWARMISSSIHDSMDDLSRKIWTGEKIGPAVHFFP